VLLAERFFALQVFEQVFGQVFGPALARRY
jgi:hypothetical protein